MRISMALCALLVCYTSITHGIRIVRKHACYCRHISLFFSFTLAFKTITIIIVVDSIIVCYLKFFTLSMGVQAQGIYHLFA